MSNWPLGQKYESVNAHHKIISEISFPYFNLTYGVAMYFAVVSYKNIVQNPLNLIDWNKSYGQGRNSLPILSSVKHNLY